MGDGGSNQGTTLESYNLAKVWNLPAVFVVEDNGYAQSTASTWSVGGSQVKRAEGFGMPGRKVDGHDFFDVYDAAQEAITRARRLYPGPHPSPTGGRGGGAARFSPIPGIMVRSTSRPKIKAMPPAPPVRPAAEATALMERRLVR